MTRKKTRLLQIFVSVFAVVSIGCSSQVDAIAFNALYPFKKVNEMYKYELPEGVFEIDTPDFFAWEIPGPGPKIMYLHGNGESLTALSKSGLLDELKKLGHLFVVEYPGLNPVPGKPSQEALVLAGVHCYLYIQDLYEGEEITVIGRSLGAAVGMQVASAVSPDKLVLISPWRSFKLAAYEAAPNWLVNRVSDKFWAANLYDTESIAASYSGPALVIHGSEDEVIPYSHGEVIAEKLRALFVTVNGAGHNDIFIPSVLQSISIFLE